MKFGLFGFSMNKVTIAGREAAVMWGYHTAARIGEWTIAASGLGGTLTAAVVSADAFRTSQPSLTFRVSRQNGTPWVWPVHTLHIADGSLTATLGPQE